MRGKTGEKMEENKTWFIEIVWKIMVFILQIEHFAEIPVLTENRKLWRNMWKSCEDAVESMWKSCG